MAAKRKREEDAATLMRLVAYTSRPLKDRRSVLAVPAHDFQKVRPAPPLPGSLSVLVRVTWAGSTCHRRHPDYAMKMEAS
jgi:hypothetical protein